MAAFRVNRTATHSLGSKTRLGVSREKVKYTILCLCFETSWLAASRSFPFCFVSIVAGYLKIAPALSPNECREKLQAALDTELQN